MTDYSPFTGRRVSERPQPRYELAEIAWQMRAPSGRILECGIYRTDFGHETRVGYGDELLASQFAPTLQVAREHAERFRQDVKPTFTPVEKP